MSSDRSGGLGLAMILGFAVGAVTALLMAPSAGIETRRKVGDAAKRIRGQAEGRLREVRTKVARRTGDLRSAVEAGRDAYQESRGIDSKLDKTRQPVLEAEPSGS